MNRDDLNAAIDCKRADLRDIVDQINTCAAVGTFYAEAETAGRRPTKLNVELTLMEHLREKETTLRAELATLLRKCKE
jgi:hypothetical protein